MEFDHVSISYLDLSRVLQGVPRRNAKASFGELMLEARQLSGDYSWQSSFFARHFAPRISVHGCVGLSSGVVKKLPRLTGRTRRGNRYSGEGNRRLPV